MPGGPLKSFNPTPVCLECASAENVPMVRSMTVLIWVHGGMCSIRYTGLPLPISNANAGDLGAGFQARSDFQGHSLAVALDHDVLCFAGAFPDELDELISAVQRNLREHQDLIASLHPGRMRRAIGVDPIDDRVVARVEIENLEAEGLAHDGRQLVGVGELPGSRNDHRPGRCCAPECSSPERRARR